MANFHFLDLESTLPVYPTIGAIALTYTAGLPDLSLFLRYISLFRFMVFPPYFIDSIFIAIKKKTNMSLLFKSKSNQLLNKYTVILSSQFMP